MNHIDSVDTLDGAVNEGTVDCGVRYVTLYYTEFALPYLIEIFNSVE